MRFKSVHWGTIAFLLIVLVACGQADDRSVTDNKGGNNSPDVGSEAKEQLNEWPTDTLTLVVPYSTGGSADRQARALAPILEEELGVPVLVENREGAGGATGSMSHLQRDPDDGSYIIYQSHPHFESGIIRDTGYEFDDFDYLGMTHSSPIAVFVRADSEIETFHDLIAAMENNPGELNFGMMSGDWSDVAGAMMSEELNLEVRAVPFDGGGPQRTSLLGGQTDFIYSDLEGTLAAAGDEINVLASFSTEPYEPNPDIPLINDLMNEMGHAIEFPNMANMRSLQVKKGFKDQYPDRWDMLIEAIEAAVTSDAFREWGEAQGMYLKWSGSDEAYKVLKEGHNALMEYRHLFE